MGKKDDLVSRGKFLALLLRHKPETLGLHMDDEGWVNISELVHTGEFTRQMIFDIVDTNNKKRYGLDEHRTRIRALQGHSVPVNLNLKSVKPPDALYHGTPRKSVDSIMKSGLNSGSRQHVHLSVDKETAVDVGTRRDSSPTILHIFSGQMFEDGHDFFVSENGVWLTNFVPAQYISTF